MKPKNVMLFNQLIILLFLIFQHLKKIDKLFLNIVINISHLIK